MISFRATAIGFATAVFCLSSIVVAAQQLDEPIELRERANEDGVASQKRVEKIASETDGLVAEYRLTNRKIESLRIFNDQLRRVIADQEEELASLQSQIDDVQETSRAVTPLMLKMIDALDRFVAIDMPFLADERKERVDKLRVLMRRADVADAERYRSILEAYQIENDYGRTIEAYAGTVPRDGVEVPVDFLRIGRLALLYQTRDGEEVGAWDQKNERWVTLDSSYKNSIDEGLRVAKKQAAPQMIRVPLPRPKDASGGQG